VTEQSRQENDTVLSDQAFDALLRTGRLTKSSLATINAFMLEKTVGFAEAATALGLFTTEELRRALENAKSLRPRASKGIIEDALSRGALNQFPVVKKTPQAQASRSLALIGAPASPYAEQIRALRTELLMAMDSLGTPYAFCVTSPCAKEGRTQLCAELAVGFSQIGRRTLLVDADLRKSRMHELLEFDGAFGLAQTLLGGRVAAPAFAVSNVPNLSFVPSGPVIDSPLEALSSGWLEKQVAEWYREYEVVIVDTPPVVNYPDGVAIAACVRRVLVSTRAKSTNMAPLKEMLRRLGATQAQVIGAIINEF
jgi:protein-tyrosine kinase